MDAAAAEDLELRRDGEPYRSAIVIRLADGRPTGQFVFELGPSQRIESSVLRAAFATAPCPLAPLIEPLAPLPSVSVVVNTCGRAEETVRAVRSVLACRPAPLEVIVVENRPLGSPVRGALARAFGTAREHGTSSTGSQIRYVEEARVGLSAARNAGLAAARGEVVAFTDDDVVVQEGWLRWLAASFAAEPDAGCVTGLILPADLETRTQLRIEQFAGFGKGFERRVFRAERPTSPLFPFAAGEFGSGACTALRADAARALGGFDPALGAGTRACGGEDLDLFVRVLMAGYALVYEPAAMLWHEHPDGDGRLGREIFGYGVSLTAMLTKQALAGHAPEMLRRVPAAVRFMRDPQSRKNIRKAPDYPRTYDWLELAGLAWGPLAYALSRRRAEAAGENAPAGYRPTWMGQLELGNGLRSLKVPPRPDGGRYDRARLLVTREGSAVGFVEVPVNGHTVHESRLAAQVRRLLHLGPASPPNGDRPPIEPAAELISVIVCTCNRPASLRKTLRSILAADWPCFEVIVVDNAPALSATRDAVEELMDGRLRYVPEPVAGLSRARNRGVLEARGEIVAFTDDDVIADPGWLPALAAGFTRGSAVACVTGLVPAAELATAPQAYFDAKVKWSQSLRPRLYDTDRNRGSAALYPYAAGEIGAGANFAVRRREFDLVGSFDEALGVGTPSEGGEDLDFFARLLLAGRQIAFEPSAIVWHEHRRDVDALRSQMHGYGAGLTAYAFKHLVFGDAAGHAWRALRNRQPGSPGGRELPAREPSKNISARVPPTIPGMQLAELRGLVYGPLGYLRGRYRARRHAPLDWPSAVSNGSTQASRRRASAPR